MDKEIFGGQDERRTGVQADEWSVIRNKVTVILHLPRLTRHTLPVTCHSPTQMVFTLTNSLIP